METILLLHSLNRWLILLLAVIVSLLGAWGYFARRPFASFDNGVGLVYVTLMDIQILLGLLLLILGGFSSRAVLHALVMLVAIAIAHIGRARSRRAEKAQAKHLMQGLGVFLSLLIIGAGLPFVTK